MEHATVRVTDVLKVTPPYEKRSYLLELKDAPAPVINDTFDATGAATTEYSPLAFETPLTVGKRFLMLVTPDSLARHTLSAARCLVIPDTAENRAELLRGAAQNDQPRNAAPNNWPRGGE